MENTVFSINLRGKDSKKVIEKLDKVGYKYSQKKNVISIAMPETDELFWAFFDVEE